MKYFYFSANDWSSDISIIEGFVKIVKQILSLEEFAKERIIPNQNYKLCCINELFVDKIENDNLFNSIKKLFDYDLKDILVHSRFIDIGNYKIIDFNYLSKKIIELLDKENIRNKNESDRIEFYSIFLQNPAYYENQINVIIDFFKFFF